MCIPPSNYSYDGIMVLLESYVCWVKFRTPFSHPNCKRKHKNCKRVFDLCFLVRKSFKESSCRELLPKTLSSFEYSLFLKLVLAIFIAYFVFYGEGKYILKNVFNTSINSFPQINRRFLKSIIFFIQNPKLTYAII